MKLQEAFEADKRKLEQLSRDPSLNFLALQLQYAPEGSKVYLLGQYFYQTFEIKRNPNEMIPLEVQRYGTDVIAFLDNKARNALFCISTLKDVNAELIAKNLQSKTLKT